jgi:hypothetical protein
MNFIKAELLGVILENGYTNLQKAGIRSMLRKFTVIISVAVLAIVQSISLDH